MIDSSTLRCVDFTNVAKNATFRLTNWKKLFIYKDFVVKTIFCLFFGRFAVKRGGWQKNWGRVETRPQSNFLFSRLTDRNQNHPNEQLHLNQHRNRCNQMNRMNPSLHKQQL